MLGIIFVLSVFYTGFFISTLFFRNKIKELALPLSFFSGSLLCVTIVLLFLLLLKNFTYVIFLYFFIFLFIALVSFKKNYSELLKLRLEKSYLLFYLPLFIVLFFIFQRSFSYSESSGKFLIQSHLFVDMGVHVPTIRFFSEGKNFLPEIPFYSGSGHFYHFMFDFYAAILEFLGLQIDYALNMLSAITLVFLLQLIYHFSNFLFRNKIAGILACFLYLFNSDLSFVQRFFDNGFSLSTLKLVYFSNDYVQGKLFGLVFPQNFLHINVLLNQRQTLFATFSVLSILYILLRNKKLSKKQLVFLAVLIGLLPFWSFSSILIIYIVLIAAFILFKDLRPNIANITLISLVLVLPQIILIKLNSISHFYFRPGFIIWNNFSIWNFSLFWLWNLGVSLPIVVISFFQSNTFQKKIFIAFSALFLFANLFQFSPEMLDNHKFFSLWIIIVNIYCANLILKIYREKKILAILSSILFIFSIASGVFNLFVVKNDVYAQITDYKKSNLIKSLNSYTNGNSIIFTNGDIYDPLNIAGYKTFLGRPHYIYTYGGNPDRRIKERDIVFSGKDKKSIMKILNSYKIQYIIIYKKGFIQNEHLVNTSFLNSNFKKIYEDTQGIIYKI